MTGLTRWVLVAAVAMLTQGCFLIPTAAETCAKPQPYESAAEVPPLQVPEGADLPDTRNALKIPAVTAPERPKDAASCLDHPPPFGVARPRAG